MASAEHSKDPTSETFTFALINNENLLIDGHTNIRFEHQPGTGKGRVAVASNNERYTFLKGSDGKIRYYDFRSRQESDRFDEIKNLSQTAASTVFVGDEMVIRPEFVIFEPSNDRETGLGVVISVTAPNKPHVLMYPGRSLTNIVDAREEMKRKGWIPTDTADTNSVGETL